ncbi:DNA polymerase III subunit gamma/tau [Aquisalimonas lutea]|uniref:DNA polymerase III subunit gamma/tau n=1 Tax=Aquisalimonas lutea TaxID=1327750 RepID=UPI0025B2F737|nr:DNA polymerase III subunit gamma/tau [Aquisalimonas lutea]MDN3518331.1 DNA polymerase III subunit gamma/tau [Aquisalimonas lutea]
MSYQVLARKYRPRSFATMAGQEHVLQALVNGLDHDRLHHAYLFTGTRGVGKTTLARVLAKCLNCEQGVGSEPCGACSACTAIDDGRFVDLIEVDAASRTRVEDTRELLDNVQYAPTHGRYKIYLVDEVHMLSTHSFNALLKTLEEPPPHVKFLLATTDPQKVPVTILSRCLQFNLKRLPASLIGDYLRGILEQEGVQAESAALARLARAADGSMRDALSLTDQALAFGGGQISDDGVRGMLGSIEDHSVLEILEALAARDGTELMAIVERLSERSPDFADVLAAILTQLHALSLLQTVPDALDPEHPDRDRLEALAAALPPEDVQLFYQIGLTGRRDLPLAPEPRMGFEMVLLRMLAFRPDDDPGRDASTGGGWAQTAPARASASAGSAAATATPEAGPSVSATASTAEAEEQPPADDVPEPGVPLAEEGPPGPAAAPEAETAVAEPVPAAVPAAGASSRGGTDDLPPWHELIGELGLTGMARALAMQCSWGGFEQGTVTLELAGQHASLRNKQLEERIETALASHLGGAVQLRIRIRREAGETLDTPAGRAEEARRERQEAAEAAIRQDPAVAEMQHRFGAEVVPDSIQPTEI